MFWYVISPYPWHTYTNLLSDLANTPPPPSLACPLKESPKPINGNVCDAYCHTLIYFILYDILDTFSRDRSEVTFFTSNRKRLLNWNLKNLWVNGRYGYWAISCRPYGAHLDSFSLYHRPTLSTTDVCGNSVVILLKNFTIGLKICRELLP